MYNECNFGLVHLNSIESQHSKFSVFQKNLHHEWQKKYFWDISSADIVLNVSHIPKRQLNDLIKLNLFNEPINSKRSMNDYLPFTASPIVLQCYTITRFGNLDKTLELHKSGVMLHNHIPEESLPIPIKESIFYFLITFIRYCSTRRSIHSLLCWQY
jgi:hypothetical protein